MGQNKGGKNRKWGLEVGQVVRLQPYARKMEELDGVDLTIMEFGVAGGILLRPTSLPEWLGTLHSEHEVIKEEESDE